jgi:hypothetical protein
MLLVDLAVKAIAVGLPLYAIVALDAAHGAGTAIVVRLLAYPISVAVVPLLWLSAGRPRPYPFLADIALVVPFILDAARIGLELSSSRVLDALPHVGGWLSISVVVGLALGPIVRERWIGFGLMVGTGATIAIAWEVGEFLISRGGGGFELTYGNTIADLALSLSGAIVGASLMVLTRWPGPETPRTPFGWAR